MTADPLTGDPLPAESGPDAAAVARLRRLQAVAALFAVLLFQVVFGTSYIAAFHNPKPVGIPFAVSAPTAQVKSLAIALIRKQAGTALSVRSGGTATQVWSLIARRSIDGAYVIGSKGDTLLIASAASLNEAQSLTSLFQAAARQQQRVLTVHDVAPLPSSDPRGLAPFYLVITWVVGGYLGATLLGLVRGMAAANGRLSMERVGGLLAYAIVSGVVITLVERAAFGVAGGHVVQLCLVGGFVVFAAASAAAGLQALLGLAGTAIVLILFVALGNPSAGGPVSYHLLPTFFRGIGPYIVNGAGVDLTRNTLYFGAHSLLRPVLVLSLWALAGVTLTMVIGGRKGLAATRMQGGAAGVAGV